MSKVYIGGHQPSVLRSHTWRTAENSAGYLLPYLKPDMHLLDVGCGPGTITLDFASRLSQGHVWGVDPSTSVIAQARHSAASRCITNVTFIVGDVFALQDILKEQKFDVVHAHQVLQHVAEPKQAMLAMKSVLKPAGILAARETDFSAMAWYPLLPGLEDWRSTWQKVSRASGCNPDTGRESVALALQAGFSRDQITATAGAWCYSTPEEREWWGGLWAERALKSDFAKKVVDGGFGTQQRLEEWSSAWSRWAAAEDGWFALLHGEVICRT